MINRMRKIQSVFNLRKQLLGLSFILVSSIASAQCSSDAFMDNCSSALDDFNFIKSFEYVNPKGGAKNEYSYVFSKGSTYRIVVCDENIAGNRMIISLYDRNHKLIASNFDKASKKVFPALTYPCSATGVYYIEYSFQGDKAKCGINILGFTKN
jgi:hypothetical protein